eukprot:CFRG2130T1
MPSLTPAKSSQQHLRRWCASAVEKPVSPKISVGKGKGQGTAKMSKGSAKEHTNNTKEVNKQFLNSTKLEQSSTPSVVAKPKTPTMWEKVKHEVEHYYTGFKLFFIDVRISSRYLFQAIQGETLTRRQRRQLVRTTGDIFRLIPFSVFIIIPFMEFLLPVALKLFPNMLPSTFNSKSQKDEKQLKQLKIKLEMAKFLQDTVEDLAKKSSSQKGDDGSVSDFSDLMSRISTTDNNVSTAELLKFSKLFEDELTLDNLDRPQLVALCRMLNLNTYGTLALLRFQLRTCLRQLSADDVMIMHEGIDSLTVDELQHACAERGMRSMGIPLARLRDQLEQWLKLNKEGVPASLILLSRTLYLNGEVDKKALKDTISSLSHNLVGEAEMIVSRSAGKDISNKQRLKILKEEERMLREEEEEAEREKREKIAAKLIDDKRIEVDRDVLVKSAKKLSEALEPAMAVQASIHLDTVVRELEQKKERETRKKEAAGTISREDLSVLAEAIHVLTAPRSGQVREELAELINERKERGELTDGNYPKLSSREMASEVLPNLPPDTANTLVQDMRIKGDEGVDARKKEGHEKEGKLKIDGNDKVARVAKALESKLESMMVEMEKEWSKVEDTIAKSELFDSSNETEEAEADAFLTLEQIINMGRGAMKGEDARKIEQIVKILDVDGDGIVTIEEMRNVFKQLNQEGTDITPGDLARIVQLVHLEGLNDKAKELSSKSHVTESIIDAVSSNTDSRSSST